jgi:hypothetical protein
MAGSGLTPPEANACHVRRRAEEDGPKQRSDRNRPVGRAFALFPDIAGRYPPDKATLIAKICSANLIYQFVAFAYGESREFGGCPQDFLRPTEPKRVAIVRICSLRFTAPRFLSNTQRTL